MMEYMEHKGVGNEEIDRFMGWTTVDLRDERLRSAKPTSKEGRWKRGAAERGNVGAREAGKGEGTTSGEGSGENSQVEGEGHDGFW